MHPEAFHHFTNAVIYEQERLYDHAIREYDIALSYEPLSYDIRLVYGQFLLNLNRASQALDILLPIPDKDSRVFGLIGDCYRQTGLHAEAEEAYRRALAGDSTNVTLNYNLGLYSARANRLNEAAHYFRQAAQYSMDAFLLQRIAEMYANVGQYDSAVVFIEAALKITTDLPELYARHSIYLHALGKHQEAKQALERGIILHPGESRLLGQLLETYNAEGNIDSVNVIAEQLLALESADKLVFERLGLVFLRGAHAELAPRFFRKLLTIDPETDMGFSIWEDSRLRRSAGTLPRSICGD